jgi:type III secretion protein C
MTRGPILRQPACSEPGVTRPRRAPLAAILAGAAAVLGLTPAVQAARIPFPNQRVSYDLQREGLREFLRRFFEDLAIPIVISEQVERAPGTLNGPREGTAADVFKGIAASNGLIGYYDGSVAYIYKSHELSSRILQIDPAHVDAFREATVGFGLTDANDSVQVKAQIGLVSATGTPRFLDQVGQLSSALARRSAVPPSASMQAQIPRMTLRFFPLKYAWAADTAFTFGNQRTVVPGVATILRQLLGSGESAAHASSGTSFNSLAVTGLRGKGLAALADRLTRAGQDTPNSGYVAGGSSSPDAAGAGPGYGGASSGYPVGGSGGPAYPSDSPRAEASQSPHVQSAFAAVLDTVESPRIVADPYRNAIIIRDLPDRMPLYEDLVRQLDVESQIIQLDATVIDIDKRRVRQLGIDWSYQHGNTSAAFGGGIHPVDLAGNLSGLQVNSIITDASTFMARVNALEQEGVTNVVQRPQVVTLNDVEAVIESTQSYYIPVSGAYDEDLYGIVAGTVLRVTPHMIDDQGRKRIRLLVTVEDGNVQITSQPAQSSNGQSITQSVPLVTRNAVNTQAIINVGEGLLLGGLVRHDNTQSTNKIPLLGNIPLLGRLFRGETVSRQNTERLFLISPQIIVASTAAAP